MRGLLALTLGYAAFAFGGAEASVQFMLTVNAGLLLALVAWRLLFEPGFRFTPTWMWLPVGLLILVAAVQLVPLPIPLVEVLSPARVAQYEPVLGDETIPEQMTLSAAPSATRHALRLALLAGAILMAVTSCVKTRRDVEVMLAVVFVIGCLESMLAVTQIAGGADKLYGIVDPGEHGMMTAGSFVNHSHFAQLVNLAIGAGVGLLLMRLHADESRARLGRQDSWILAGLALCTFAVCLSLSRAGIVSLVAAVGFTGSMLAMRRGSGRRGWTLCSIFIGALLLLLVFGLEGFYRRLATLGQEGAFQDRWALTSASLDAGADYPLVGAGLGTYAHVFPAYDTTGSPSVATYADNDYAQLFVEGGLIGVAILTILILTVTRALLLCLRTRQSSCAQAAWGILTSCVAIGIHSATDFGQRLPGVFLTTATLLGILSVLPIAIRNELGGDIVAFAVGRRPGLLGQAMRLAGVAGMAIAIAWMFAGAFGHYQAERWWATALIREAALRERDWQGTDDQYAALLQAAENQVAWESDNAEAHYQLNLTRWLSINRSTQIALGAGAITETERQIVERIVQELTEVRRLEPCFAAPYLLEGQLRTYLLGDVPGGGKLIAHAARLDVGNSRVQFRHGEWLAYFGSADAAKEVLQRSVNVDGRQFSPAADLVINVLSDVPTAIAWGAEDIDRMAIVARLLEASPKHEEQLLELRARMERLELQLARRGEASPAQLASLGDRAAQRGDYEEAVAFYRQALSKQFHLPAARLGLAQALLAQGKSSDALTEVKTCLRHDPDNAEAKRLVEQLVLGASPSGDR